jgi:hypothetical protein
VGRRGRDRPKEKEGGVRDVEEMTVEEEEEE